MKLIIALLAGVVIFYLSALKWRRSLKAVFILLVFEGALRKWVLPQASEMIYFLKDVVLIGAYLNFYAFSVPKDKLPRKGGRKIVNILIFIAMGWCIFQVFNPSLGSPLVGIFGLRGYLVYIPLIWMIPYLFESEDELYKFLRSHLLLTIPCGLIGIVQFFSPYDSFINAYADEAAVGKATFGATLTTSSVGPSEHHSATWPRATSSRSVALLIALLSFKQSLKWQLLGVIALFLVSINSFMTGSRTTILAEVLFLIGYLCAKGLTRPSSAVRLLKKLIVPTIIVAIAGFIWFSPAIEAFWLRTTSNKDVSGRILLSFTEPIDFIKYKELDGFGTGATHQAAPTIRLILNLPPGEVIPTYFEPEMGRIALELGPLGFLFWYGLRVSILIMLLRTFLTLKTRFLRELALVAFLLQLIQINGFLVFHHTYAVYYWFLSSFIFLLPRLEQIENWQREQQFWQEHVLSSYFPDSSYR